MRAELTRLRQALEQDRVIHQETAQRLDAAETRLREARDEQTFWEQMASEAEAAKATLEQRLAASQAESTAQPREAVTAFVAAANTAAAAVHLDEAETRKLIDQQLLQAGWNANSVTLIYSQGARPEKNTNLAIAEWPTQSGPADYVLFVGLTPIAVVEAKRQNVDVSAALQQAKRYSRGFTPSPETALHAENWGPDGAYRLPFAFASNGRPFLRQLATKSGIWFCDLRRPENLGRALDGWYTPEGLTALLKRDESRAHAQLKHEPFTYGFALRHYQQAAIQAAEAALAGGQRDMLLAMATGTGKTKTCIALIYRLLKAQRFRRVLFLVDRSALGEQAANAFKDTRMESLQTFADIFGIKELDKAGFSEASLATAWREMTNQDIAARIVGYIRQAAIGDPLVPYDQRVDRALQKLLASRQWSTPQRQWLQRIAAQTKANMLVDREALDDPDLVFKREGGGFARLDRIFGGELQQVLDTFNDSLWPPAA